MIWGFGVDCVTPGFIIIIQRIIEHVFAVVNYLNSMDDGSRPFMFTCMLGWNFVHLIYQSTFYISLYVMQKDRQGMYGKPPWDNSSHHIMVRTFSGPPHALSQQLTHTRFLFQSLDSICTHQMEQTVGSMVNFYFQCKPLNLWAMDQGVRDMRATPCFISRSIITYG